jgi:hypothetical protein
VAQIFMQPQKSRGLPFVRRGTVPRIVSLAGDVQVTIVADRSSQRSVR